MKNRKLHRCVIGPPRKTPMPDQALSYALAVAENEGWPRPVPVDDGWKIAFSQPGARSAPLPG